MDEIDRDQIEKDNFYIPAKYNNQNLEQYASMGHLLKCHKCEKKILVSLGLIGTPHHIGISATCAECLEIDKDFCKEHPKIANRLDNWKNEL